MAQLLATEHDYGKEGAALALPEPPLLSRFTHLLGRRMITSSQRHRTAHTQSILIVVVHPRAAELLHGLAQEDHMRR